jgi:hypothetical protein
VRSLAAAGSSSNDPAPDRKFESEITLRWKLLETKAILRLAVRDDFRNWLIQAS